MDRNRYRRPTKSQQEEHERLGEWELVAEKKPLPKWLSILPPPVRKVVGSPLLTLALACILLFYVYHTQGRSGRHVTKSSFMGSQFWNDEKTVEVTTLHETPFARFQIHKVKAGNDIIDDWLWCDELDSIIALVLEAETGKYILFRQKKYGIPGPPTLATVGGLVEPGEDPLKAAKREVMEELKMESNDWVALGSYRVAANRGAGITHTFLAKNATVSTQTISTVKGQSDLERQDIVKYTEEELLDLILEGKFGEIKWAATAAFSLLKLRS